MKFALYSSCKECHSSDAPVRASLPKNKLACPFLVIYVPGCPNRLPPGVILVADNKNRGMHPKGELA